MPVVEVVEAGVEVAEAGGLEAAGADVDDEEEPQPAATNASVTSSAATVLALLRHIGPTLCRRILRRRVWRISVVRARFADRGCGVLGFVHIGALLVGDVAQFLRILLGRLRTPSLLEYLLGLLGHRLPIHLSLLVGTVADFAL